MDSRRLGGAGVVTAFLLAACGGGGGGSRPVQDPAPTSVALGFPTRVGLTDADTTAVGGGASDLDGVASVTVAGVAAASGDGFASWNARVPLAEGVNVLSIDAIDGRGRPTRGAATAATAAIRRAPADSDPFDVVFDAARGRLLILDVTEASIRSFDLATGDHDFFSDDKHGKGPPLDFPFAMDLDPAGDQLIVVDRRTVIAVDLDDGNRTLLASNGDGLGPDFGNLDHVAVDSVRRIAYVLDAFGTSGTPLLIAVDVATGKRGVLSGDGVGSGPPFQFPDGIAVIEASSIALVSDLLANALFAVDLVSGARTIVSDASRGAGPPLTSAGAVAAASDGSTAWVETTDALLEVNLVTGDRAVVADTQRGAGPLPSRYTGLELLDEPDGQLLGTTDDLSTVLRIDVATGDREDLLEGRAGGGVPLQFCFGLAVQADGRRAFVPTGFQGLVAVDLLDSDRSPLSGRGAGSGEPLDFAARVGLDEATGRAIVLDSFDGTLLAVELATGNRTLFSSDDAGNGPSFNSLNDVIVDEQRRLAFVSDREFIGSASVGRIVAVDLATGDRTIVSGTTRGAGPPLQDAPEIQVDSPRNRLLAVDNDAEALFAIDLVTGDRELLSHAGRGAGPLWSSPRALALAPDGLRVFVVDFVAGGHDLYEVELATGDRFVALAAVEGIGPRLRNVRKIAFLADGRLIGADHVRSALMTIDLATGDRVITSQ